MKVVAETLGVARSNLVDRLKGKTKPRRRYHKAQDADRHAGDVPADLWLPPHHRDPEPPAAV